MEENVDEITPVQIHLFDFDYQQIGKEYKWLQRKLSNGLVASINILEYPKLPKLHHSDTDEIKNIIYSEKYHSFIVQYRDYIVVLNRNDREQFKILDSPTIKSLLLDDESDAVYVIITFHSTHHDCQKLNLQKLMSLPDGEFIGEAAEWYSTKRLKNPGSTCLQYENGEQVLYILDEKICVYNVRTGSCIKQFSGDVFKGSLNAMFAVSINELLIVGRNSVIIYKRNEEEQEGEEWNVECEKKLSNCLDGNQIVYDRTNGLIYAREYDYSAGNGIVVLRRRDLEIIKSFKIDLIISQLFLNSPNETLDIIINNTKDSQN